MCMRQLGAVTDEIVKRMTPGQRGEARPGPSVHPRRSKIEEAPAGEFGGPGRKLPACAEHNRLPADRSVRTPTLPVGSVSDRATRDFAQSRAPRCEPPVDDGIQGSAYPIGMCW